MNRSLALILTLITALLLGGCGFLGDAKDETIGWSAQQLYNEAKTAMNDGKYDQAIKYFEKLEARFPYGRFAQQAQIEVAYSYFKQGEVESAIAACDRFIKLYPNHSNVDYAYYLKGLTHFNQDIGIVGRLGDQDPSERDPKAARDSFDAFKELAARYPDSKYAPDSIVRMRYLINALGAHEVHVARYYVKREAYVAATTRVQYALANFPTAPSNEEGLYLLVKSYDALGLADLRDDADRVLRKNFPDSVYIKGTTDAKSQWWKLWK